MSMSDQTTYKRIKEIERSSDNIENKYFAMDSNSGTEKVILSSVLDDKLGTIKYEQTDSGAQTIIGKFTDKDGIETPIKVPYENPAAFDSTLSGTSENAPQNKVVKAAIDEINDAISGLDSSVEAALDEKVDIVDGKGLSTEDYTTEEKTKLEKLGLTSSYIATRDRVENNILYFNCEAMSGEFSGTVGEMVNIVVTQEGENEESVDFIEIPEDLENIIFHFEECGDQSYDHKGESHFPVWYNAQPLIFMSNGEGTIIWTEAPYADVNSDAPGLVQLTSDTSDSAVTTKAVTPKYVTDVLANDDDEYMTKSAILDAIYPVGSIHITLGDYNPGNVFGGTWVKIAPGRFLLGDSRTEDNNYSGTVDWLPGSMNEQAIVGENGSGGDCYANISVQNLPTDTFTTYSTNLNHQHSMGWRAMATPNTGSAHYGPYGGSDEQNYNTTVKTVTGSGSTTEKSLNHPHDFKLNTTGTQSPLTIMPPYLVVYMWQKTENAILPTEK